MNEFKEHDQHKNKDLGTRRDIIAGLVPEHLSQNDAICTGLIFNEDSTLNKSSLRTLWNLSENDFNILDQNSIEYQKLYIDREHGLSSEHPFKIKKFTLHGDTLEVIYKNPALCTQISEDYHLDENSNNWSKEDIERSIQDGKVTINKNREVHFTNQGTTIESIKAKFRAYEECLPGKFNRNFWIDNEELSDRHVILNFAHLEELFLKFSDRDKIMIFNILETTGDDKLIMEDSNKEKCELLQAKLFDFMSRLISVRENNTDNFQNEDNLIRLYLHTNNSDSSKDNERQISLLLILQQLIDCIDKIEESETTDDSKQFRARLVSLTKYVGDTATNLDEAEIDFTQEIIRSQGIIKSGNLVFEEFYSERLSLLNDPRKVMEKIKEILAGDRKNQNESLKLETLVNILRGHIPFLSEQDKKEAHFVMSDLFNKLHTDNEKDLNTIDYLGSEKLIAELSHWIRNRVFQSITKMDRGSTNNPMFFSAETKKLYDYEQEAQYAVYLKIINELLKESGVDRSWNWLFIPYLKAKEEWIDAKVPQIIKNLQRINIPLKLNGKWIISHDSYGCYGPSQDRIMAQVLSIDENTIIDANYLNNLGKNITYKKHDDGLPEIVEM